MVELSWQGLRGGCWDDGDWQEEGLDWSWDEAERVGGLTRRIGLSEWGPELGLT